MPSFQGSEQRPLADANTKAQAALILVLGDQLSHHRNALKDAVPGRDIIVMAEVSSEASYVGIIDTKLR